jgi:hypothetical protein
MESIDALQAVERECIARFRKRAAKISAANPQMTPQVAYAKAVESLPRTADKYQYARQRLTFCGVAALPLR